MSSSLGAPVPPTDRPSRVWWRVLGGIAAVFVLAAALLQVVGLIARSTETQHRVLDVDGVERLVVDSSEGDVSITGSARDDLRFVAELEHGLRRARVRIERDGDTLRATSHCPPFPGFCAVDFAVEVPRGLEVVARSDNGDVSAGDLADAAELSSGNGNVRVANMSGDARLASGNGDVTATALQGRLVDATSRNGDVSVDLAAAPQQVIAKSANGNVDVAVPDDGEPYALDVSTSNGSRSADIRTDPQSSRHLRVHSANGDVAVRYRLR